MTTAQHGSLAAGRWQTFALVEQLANIGSEVERALRADMAGRTDRRDRALTRALELFDLTATDHRWRGPRRREVLRAREYVCRLFFDETLEADATEFLQSYFLQFANAARRRSPGVIP
jgi:hypothetical protein